MYSILDYGGMIADRVRMDAYLEALASVIKPGSVVVDLGCGPGVMALHACRLGAARVYAVEPDDSIAVAMELARANGMADRIRFFQEPAETLELPEPADVIVSDLRGVLSLHGSHLEVIADVRMRWLRPGGTLIPATDTLRACLVSHAAYHDSLLKAWSNTAHGMDLTSGLKWCVNLPQKVGLKPEALAVAPQTWGLLDYRVHAGSNAAGDLSWRVEAPATVHGIALWFDTELIEGVGFSNAPGPGAGIYGQWFLPWPQPVALGKDDEVKVSLAATISGTDYHWRWTTQILESAGQGRHKFSQASFLGAPVGPKTLKSRAETHVPKFSAKGKATRITLGGIREGLPLGDIARRLLSECAGEFRGNFQKALTFAADVGDKYS